MNSKRIFFFCVFVALGGFGFCEAPQLEIPRIDQSIGLKDFDGMKLPPHLLKRVAVIEDFVQREPSDGGQPSQKTVVYVAYDAKNLYVVFVCYDTNPERVASSMTRREGFSGDEDWIEFYLDTFNDQRRAYCFSTNPLGIQWDSRYSEATGEDGMGGHQPSFDALWYSEGKLTSEGYIIAITVPFKSIRFPAESVQTWRILFGRSIPRTNEYVSWPHVSRSIQGYLTQSSLLTGLNNISPGKSLQFIPYSTFRSFRLLETAIDPPQFISDSGDAAVGLDTKFVLKDSQVFDLTVNPDFSQVESDEPQVTVNQRFEVFFPEKRPFFLENAQYFETPLTLVFTRRMLDPQYGARYTGKMGPFTLGALYTNDESPGKVVPEEDPFFDSKANFGVIRMTGDIFEQSSIGVLFTSRSLEELQNQVVAGDFRFRMGDHWEANGQAVRSWNDVSFNEEEQGEAYLAQVARNGRNFEMEVTYEDYSPEFQTLTGFVPRVDYRAITATTQYYFRPSGEVLISYGPEFKVTESWDHQGLRLDSIVSPGFYVELSRRTFFRLNYNDFQQQIRPEDFEVLTEPVDFDTPSWSLGFDTAYFKWGTFRTDFQKGKDVNFQPLEEEAPFVGDSTFFQLEMNLRPLQRLQLNNSYLYSSLSSDGNSVFEDHIVSVRANYQFTRAFSMRVILQYETTIADQSLTSLEDRRNFNGDVLFTYLLNPWTALYVGYNGNRQNILLIDDPRGPRIIRTSGRLTNDANQFFMKFSYLFRL